jgi:hypothetical protein
MTIDPLRWRPHLAALLQVDAFRAELGAQTVREVQAAGTTTPSDEVLDELLAAVLEVGREVLRLEWDCESPAGSGYARLVCCADCFVLDASDDWPDSGPFSNLDDAMRCGAFTQCLADECRINSDLSPGITIALAGQLTRDRRQSIRINGRRWRWVHDSLVAPDDDNPDTRARR